jgi:hypothetical protein
MTLRLAEHPRDQVKHARRVASAGNLVHRKVGLIKQHADDLLDLPAKTLAEAFADPKKWAEASDQLASAIEALATLQSEIARRVPK